jgi:3-deoxy-manno-octulosonate cytidylyltransferase (CMP-KDO synthetase)
MKTLVVIPARYQSSRLPGKPLIELCGVPMIKRTYMQVKKSSSYDDVVVATDDARISDFLRREGIPFILTSQNCLTGTDRVAEVASTLDYDLYINVQGDEPVIDPAAIDEIISEYAKHGERYIAYNLFKERADFEDLSRDTIVKVVVNEANELLYMSRFPIPYSKSGLKPTYKQQIPIYGFTSHALKLFSSNPKTCNERYEDIEILRFVDLGFKVKMRPTSVDSIAVDVPEDVARLEKFLGTPGND